MAHRSRSKTADSAESKKTKGQPRRLTEKIAIMRRKEHEQSEAFEQAMKSIFEVILFRNGDNPFNQDCVCVCAWS